MLRRSPILLPILAAVTGLLPAACGFTPLYRQDGPDSVTPKMAAVNIEPIADRRGQVLRNQLLTALNPRGAPQTPRYHLTISLNEIITSTGVQKDETRTRGNLSIRAEIHLQRLADDKTIYNGSSAFASSYDLLLNEYATLMAKRDARDKVLTLLSQDIKTRVAFALGDEAPEAAPPVRAEHPSRSGTAADYARLPAYAYPPPPPAWAGRSIPGPAMQTGVPLPGGQGVPPYPYNAPPGPPPLVPPISGR